jgi:thioredoxin-related protein
MIDRRKLMLSGAAAAGCLGFLASPLGAAAAELGDDGLYIQPWFMQSFLDLREDLRETAGAGRRFAVIWEQKGCPYCRELHEVNLAKPEIASFIKDNFGVLQLDLWGARQVTDFDGEELEERALAQKWGVVFTPTIMFFAQAAEPGKDGRGLEVARMPGYFKPFHFVSMFEYVRQNAYETQPFQRFLQDKFARLKAEGKEADVW